MSAGVVAWSGTRGGLRAGAAADAEEPSILRVNPEDGAVGVFRDTPVIVSLSHPVDPDSLTPGAFRVETSDGSVVEGRVTAQPRRRGPDLDGRCRAHGGRRPLRRPAAGCATAGGSTSSPT